MISLRARVSVAAALVIALFIGLTALALERAFTNSSEAAMQERLFAQLYLVMATTEVDETGRVQMPPHVVEPRLNLPGSGLYARIGGPDGTTLWRSASAAGLTLPVPPWRAHGGELFTRSRVDKEAYFLAALAIEWEGPAGTVPLLFSVFEHPAPFHAQMRRYRHHLWVWLGAMALLLLLTLTGALAWGLRPLRTVAKEVSAIEAGRQGRLERDYPAEIRPLSDNINALLHHERAQQVRYQNALADLAHSLKTPLAVLRGLGEVGEHTQTLTQQVDRMDTIVQYQLQRAATTGRSAMANPLALAPVAERLLATLEKVYRDKHLRLARTLDPSATFRGAEGELMELLGNLLDNACKWARHGVWLSIGQDGATLRIRVEDDGPGIAPDKTDLALARGARLDEMTPGHGIGLTVVREIIEAHGGDLTITRSAHGGACLSVTLPA